MRKLAEFLAQRVKKAVSFVRRYSLLLPTLFSFLSFIMAVLLILSVWFTRDVVSTLENTLYENASFSSAKAADVLRSSFENMIDTAVHIKTINELTPRAYRDDSYKAFQTMKLLRSSQYSDIVLCYKDMPRLLTIYGTCYAPVCFSETDAPEETLQAIRDAASVTLLSTSLYGADLSESRLMLCYPFSSQYSAVFVMNARLVASLIENVVEPGDCLLVLYDDQGRMLWSSAELSEGLQADLFDRAVSGRGSEKMTVNGADYIFTVNRVLYGAQLVMLETISSQFDSVKAIINMLIILCVVIFILGVIFFLYGARRSYQPIDSLVRDLRGVLPGQTGAPASDIAVLRQGYSHYASLLQENQKSAALFSNTQLRNLFVLRTISGRYTDAEEMHNLCQHLNIDFPYPCFFACLFLFDNARGAQQRKEIEEYLYHTDRQLFPSCFYLLPDGHSAVGIINVPSGDEQQLSEFGERMLSHLPDSLRATLGMGQIYGDILSIGKSYLEAHAALDYRLIKGKNTWILYSEISFSNAVTTYPHQLIDSYVNTVRTWDVQSIREKLEQITAYIYSNNLPLQQVKCICFDLTSAFLREINSLDKHVTYKPGTTYDVFNIAEYDSVSELAQKIASFSENIQQYLAKHKEFQQSNLIDQCIEYMRTNISNTQFSLSSCAEQFDVAQQTLRRKFKEATGRTLSSYMTSLRIDHAKELLTSTSLDINEICEQCGYVDLSSFIRLFKSEVGVSPGKYRKMHEQ